MSDKKPSVLIVDDETIIQRAVSRALGEENYRLQVVGTVGEAREQFERGGFDVVLLDIKLPDGDGLDLVAEARRMIRGVEVIVMTGHGGVNEAVNAVKAGAYDFLTKPFDPIEKLTLAVAQAVERKELRDRAHTLARTADANYGFESIVASGPGMMRALNLARDVAYSSSTVLIRGESGTGKELIARAIHRASGRKDGPFVTVNCGALPENLIESELFGHARGSFTGAVKDKRGMFEDANGGTIFLDEIGEMPPQAQVRLLRVLQSGEVRRVGVSDARNVDVRVIAATNADLSEGMRAGTFREDLFYRLNVITVELPPLRSRRDDINVLALHFVKKVSNKLGKKVDGFTDEALRALAGYSWPGNVRELENAIERSVVLCRGSLITPDSLPEDLFRRVDGTSGSQSDSVNATLTYKEAKERSSRDFDRGYVGALLAATQGNMAEAARIAGLDRSNFRKIVKRAGVDYRDYQRGRSDADNGKTSQLTGAALN